MLREERVLCQYVHGRGSPDEAGRDVCRYPITIAQQTAHEAIGETDSDAARGCRAGTRKAAVGGRGARGVRGAGD
jgi:hypothetical protein